MVDKANHSLESRRDAREQEQLIAQSTRAGIDLVKPLVRFQTDMMVACANGLTAWTRMCVVQTEALLAYGEQLSGGDQTHQQ